MVEFRGLQYADQPYTATPATTSLAAGIAWGVLAATATYAVEPNALLAALVGVIVVVSTYRSQATLEPELTTEDPG